MTAPEKLEAQVVIRPAAESDRPALEAIAARTWDGQDYLSDMITPWLQDREGEFYVATLAGQVVGASKLTLLGAGEWWLEGIRVDPDRYGQGIGRSLHRYGVERALALNRWSNAVLRYCTGHDNSPIHKLAAETNFVLIAEFWRYQASAGPFPALFRALAPDDLPLVRSFLAESPHCEQAGRSVIGRRWVCQFITDERLHHWLAEGQVFGWYGRRTDAAHLDGLLIGGVSASWSDSQPELNILYLDAVPGSFALIAQSARGLAAQLGAPSLRHMVLKRPERLVAIEQAGWRRPKDNGGKACLFSRELGTI